MNTWQKAAVFLAVGSFPVALLMFKQSRSPWEVWKSTQTTNATTSPISAKMLDEAIEASTRELSALDSLIGVARGELMRYEDEKRGKISELQALQAKLAGLIETAAASTAGLAVGAAPVEAPLAGPVPQKP